MTTELKNNIISKYNKHNICSNRALNYKEINLRNEKLLCSEALEMYQFSNTAWPD